MIARLAAAVLVAALVPGAAAAAAPDYAMQWPVRLSDDDAGAYAATLDATVYQAVQHADLRDLDVVDAEGRPVPTDVQAGAGTARTRRVPVPWFVMPEPNAAVADDWRVIAELDAGGRLRGLHSRARLRQQSGSTLLLVTGPDAGRPVAIEFDWRPAAPFDRAYSIEASDDFETWTRVGRGRLFDLQQDGRRLARRRLVLESAWPTRYLRLVPEDGEAPPVLTSASIETRWTQAPRAQWLSPSRVARAAASAADFQMHGRFPVQWVDVEMPARAAGIWRVQSRDSADAPWVTRVNRLHAYRVGGRRSSPHRIDATVRDRHWRLVAQGPADPLPLRLGYAPERVVFVAAGSPPYRLVAGSAEGRRVASDVATTLDALRGQNGAGWQPAPASLGPAEPLRGAEALQARRDWKTWSLWAVLAAGVLVVGGFAMRLLRETAPPEA